MPHVRKLGHPRQPVAQPEEARQHAARFAQIVDPLHRRVYDRENGRELGVIKPGPEVGRASGWVDVPFGISAYRRENGEYLIFVEEDARGKVMMYRWRPR